MTQDANSTSTNTPKDPKEPPKRSGGISALEVAAQRGFGPLSPKGMVVWHGQSAPCVSCGELVMRTDISCAHCGQDLSLEMITRMQAHAGPWYVHEHVRPFPGVTLERLIRQARRGVLTPTALAFSEATASCSTARLRDENGRSSPTPLSRNMRVTRNMVSAARSSGDSALTKRPCPAVVVANHGTEPRASTPARRSSLTEMPDLASPSTILRPRGRRFGSPNARSTAAPVA